MLQYETAQCSSDELDILDRALCFVLLSSQPPSLPRVPLAERETRSTIALNGNSAVVDVRQKESRDRGVRGGEE